MPSLSISRAFARLTLLLPLIGGVCFAQTYTPTDITDLILVTGQSNVQGSGTQTDPLKDAVHERVFAYRLDPFSQSEDWERADLRQAWDVNGWHPGNGTLQCEANPATCTIPPNTPYNNFAFHFAKTVAEADPDRVVGIIIASAPGEGIKHWDAGGDFQRLIDSKVSAALNAQGVKTKLDGILWHQGETDWLIEGTSDPDATDNERTDTDYYPRKLASLIDNFRAEQWFGEERPFICGETRAAVLNVHLRSLNMDGDDWTGCVQGSDLSTRDAQTHFDAGGLRAIGSRYGEKYLEMTGFKPTEPDNVPPVTFIEGTTTTAIETTVYGYATDTGTEVTAGSGFNHVRVALKNLASNHWLDFESGKFTGNFKTTHGMLENSTNDRTDWKLTANLVAGSYKAFAIATDGLGNFKRTATGGRHYTTTRFQIKANSQPPELEIETPVDNAMIAGNVTLEGMATAYGGTPITKIRIAIKNLNTGEWYNATNSSFSPGFKHTLATITDGVDGTYNWSYTASLAAGSYKFFANPIDSTGSFPTNSAGSRDYKTVRFSVTGNTLDISPPTTTINSTEITIENDVVITGTASDTGGSGLAYIRVALKDTTNNTWYDFVNRTFATSFKHGRATMTLTDSDNATWAISPDLVTGRYKVFALAEDNNSNYKKSNTGTRVYETAVFFVE